MRAFHLAIVLPFVPLFCSLEPISTRAGQTKPFDVHTLVTLDRLSEPVLSPDGRRLAFTLRVTDLEANRGKKDIWIMGTSGVGLKRLTTHPADDWGPQWISDKKIAFLSSREGSTQVYAIDIDGGEAVRITDLPVDIDNLRVSPDGTLMALSAEVYVDCPDLACTAKRGKENAAKKATGRIYDNLFVRHWNTWSNGKRTHVFVMPAAGGSAPVDVMKGMDADCPTRPFGGNDNTSLSPDDAWIALNFKPPMGSQEAWSTNDDIWLAPTNGSVPPKNITEDNPARDSQPVFSPDGKVLAYLAAKRPGYEADRYRIVLYDVTTRQKTVLTEDWDRNVDDLVFSRSGDKLYATAFEIGQHAISVIDARSGNRQTLVKEGYNTVPMDTGQGIVFVRDSLTSPADFWSITVNGGHEKRLTDLNKEKMTSVKLGVPEQFSFAGAKGNTVYAYLVRPIDFDPNKKYPLALLVHGGPQGSMANHWHYRWNPQPYAAAGYAAMMIDFHGSAGYGQAFEDAVSDDWGGAPYEDLMKGTDAALARYPWIDGARACALGGSFGGYMINYIAGKTDRFRCLVTHSGNLNEYAAYFETEELWFPEWEHGGTPWNNPEGYTKHNPVALVKNWKTPTLVVHGALDFRVVETEGLSTFTVLQRMGIPSRLLYFPDEGHWVLKPANSILWYETVIDWLNKWTKS